MTFRIKINNHFQSQKCFRFLNHGNLSFQNMLILHSFILGAFQSITTKGSHQQYSLMQSLSNAQGSKLLTGNSRNVLDVFTEVQLRSVHIVQLSQRMHWAVVPQFLMETVSVDSTWLSNPFMSIKIIILSQ